MTLATTPPNQVAIIMDGNGRWAKSRGWPRTMGHKKGAETVEEIIRAAGDMGVRYLTMFAFSTENWKRPAEEVSELMGLLRVYLRAKANDMHKNNVRLRVIGDRVRLSSDIVELIEQTEKLTENNDGLTVVLAVNYSGRWDMLQATQQVAAKTQAGSLNPNDITDETVSAHLSTNGIPDPDLIIRTSGEQRISNFLLWQGAYSEYYFTGTHWPDFQSRDLAEAVAAYQARDRRFGAVHAHTA